MTSSFSRPAAAAVSAPGKVLIAGGYLVLDAAFSGAVVAASARFRCVVAADTTATTTSANVLLVTVHSPQFPADGPRQYLLSLAGIEGPAPRFEPLSSPPSPNPFIDHALRVALQLAHLRLGSDRFAAALPSDRPLIISVLADNDFYSQRAVLEARGQASGNTRREALASLPPFVAQPGPIARVQKTGLGSSAALVTSLVAGIWRYTTGTLDCDWIHAGAQVAHCLAQGKIGSGFDVASAVYGTHVYRRFPAAAIAPVLELGAKATGADLAPLVISLAPPAAATDRAFALPPRVRLALADVSAGSNTPSLVSKVLAWRAANPTDADQQWRELQECNERLVAAFRSLTSLAAADPAAYSAALEAWATTTTDGREDVSSPVAPVVDLLAESRLRMREMGESASVPIEPMEQSTLLDACMSVPGVLGAGVPGAGGYDAIYVLYADLPGVQHSLDAVLATFANVTPLLAEASPASLVDESDLVHGPNNSAVESVIAQYLAGELP
ncbi:ribosomal protein S5 domain 2-type protein [Blastocladiella britannica]|nr:ribosomal protein S5 domain 2-type protein [Blastocladiella britannica]